MNEWKRFPFVNRPFDLSVHLVDRNNNQVSGYEVRLIFELRYADDKSSVFTSSFKKKDRFFLSRKPVFLFVLHPPSLTNSPG